MEQYIPTNYQLIINKVKTARILNFAFILLNLNLIGQGIPNGNCNEASLGPGVNAVFSPSSVTNFTDTSIDQEILYLCGPNTVVYDTSTTSSTFNCRTVFLNSGTIYYTKNAGCLKINGILAKANSTVVIMPGGGGMRVWLEPNATLIDQTTGVGTLTYSCNSIIFPTVNCTTSGLSVNQPIQNKLHVLPNPASNQIKIETADYFTSTVTMIIADIKACVIEETQQVISNGVLNTHINLPNGLYFINIRLPNGTSYQGKIIVLQ